MAVRVGYKASPEQFAPRQLAESAVLAVLADRLGFDSVFVAGHVQPWRAPDAADRMIEIKLSYDPDPRRALENCRFWAPLSLALEQKHGLGSPEEIERAADELPLEQVAKRWIVVSSPQDAVAAIREYTDLRFDHLVLHGSGHDQERSLRTVAEQLMPALRDLVPAAPGPAGG